MATNVASAAVDRRGPDSESNVLTIPAARERSLSQPPDTGMRKHSQDALNASLMVGCGPDLHTPE